MDYLTFARQRFGANWVVARRTARIVRQYGESVNCISQKTLRQADLDYRAQFGDPYDKVRAQMYLALKEALLFKADLPEETRRNIEAAIKAEQERP